jgi:hypothetical protein
MTTVEIVGDRLCVRLNGWDKVWALKSRLEVPLARVRAVALAPADIKPRGLRAPGTYWPGAITAGTYRRRRGREFWSVRDKRNAVVIDLEGADYDRLVLQVPEPAATVSSIRAALRARPL